MYETTDSVSFKFSVLTAVDKLVQIKSNPALFCCIKCIKHIPAPTAIREQKKGKKWELHNLSEKQGKIV